ncbi:MAG: alpha/beta hydrolase [Acidimicrobiia bacterium]|nr:alpha/beta hydrolase [Acidimicrobiia bacterium]
MNERITLSTSDGEELEARIDSHETPSRSTVWCHPSPLHGGSMNAPLMIAVTRRLVERGHTVLRFNFRGVGESTGEHGGGEDELSDIAAAMDHASESGLPLGIGGWSFGAAMSLKWIASTGASLPYAGIAPPPEMLPGRLPEGPKTLILGTRDQVIDGPRLERYAKMMEIDLVSVPGDHFFHGRGAKIGDLVAEALRA